MLWKLGLGWEEIFALVFFFLFDFKKKKTNKNLRKIVSLQEEISCKSDIRTVTNYDVSRRTLGMFIVLKVRKETKVLIRKLGTGKLCCYT